MLNLKEKASLSTLEPLISCQMVALTLTATQAKRIASELEGNKINAIRDHPFKTSAFFRGGGVKNLPNLPMNSSKKLPTVGG